eukprot:3051209-Prymnesium_polylepis.1
MAPCDEWSAPPPLQAGDPAVIIDGNSLPGGSTNHLLFVPMTDSASKPARAVIQVRRAAPPP